MNKGTATVIGLLVGFIAGATVALLYAPQEGKKTRALIKERARAAGARVRVVRDKVSGQFKRGRGE
jgi:gas vesicle protein